MAPTDPPPPQPQYAPGDPVLVAAVVHERPGASGYWIHVTDERGQVDSVAARASDVHPAAPIQDPRIAALLQPGDPAARMSGYYFTFEATGIGLVDAVLSEIASAGKGYHSTEYWDEPSYGGGPSHIECIQGAADTAAAALRSLQVVAPTPAKTDEAQLEAMCRAAYGEAWEQLPPRSRSEHRAGMHRALLTLRTTPDGAPASAS